MNLLLWTHHKTTFIQIVDIWDFMFTCKYINKYLIRQPKLYNN